MNGPPTALPLPAWLLRWLSVDLESLEGGRATLRLARFPEGELGLLALLLLIGLVALVVHLYRREGNLPRWKKLSLAVPRSILLGVLALVAAYPVLEVERARELEAVTVVLLDDSLSFGIRDRYPSLPEVRKRLAEALGREGAELDPEAVAQLTRAELTARALSHPGIRLLERLAERNLVALYTFSDKLTPVAGESTPPAAEKDAEAGATARRPAAPPAKVELVPRGPATDLGAAVRRAVEEQAGRRVAAVVAFTDGRITQGEGVSSIAEFLARRGIPFHAVGVGDPSPPKNIEVAAFLAPERVFAGDPVAADVQIRHRGYGGATVRVEVREELAGPGGGLATARTVAERDVTLEEGASEVSVHFQLELEGVGRRKLTARIAADPEETLASDNERTAWVEVVEEAARVLLIAGGPSYEYRFLTNLLRRDRRIEVAAWLMSADPEFPQEGNVTLKKLPSEAEELFAYDVVILIDPDPEGFPPGFAELLERFVGRHSGGLFYVAGEKFSPSFFRARAFKPVHDMLPVVADVARAEALSGRGRYHERAWPIVPAPVAASHPPTRLSSDPERNRMRWQEVEGFYWSFPVRRAKPGAVTLFIHSDPSRITAQGPEPVLAWQFYEGGRTVFLASDETWRWRAASREIYEQFWIQSVRFLTEGRLRGGKRRLLETDAENYDLGEQVRISALLFDESYRPLEAESVTAEVALPEGGSHRIELRRDAGAPGWFRGVYLPQALGEHRITLSGGEEAVFTVNAPAIEFREPQLDEGALRSLAEASGGTYRGLWELEPLPEAIPDLRRTIITADEPIPLWDKPLVLGLLAGLLALEWILRKWNRLL